MFDVELEPDEPDDEVVAMLLPLSLALLLRPPSIDWFKLPIRGFLKGLEGFVTTKKLKHVKIQPFFKERHKIFKSTHSLVGLRLLPMRLNWRKFANALRRRVIRPTAAGR